ncbi:MAG: hypothetical protein AAFR87_20590 [Bacteroidota bacterium]
MKNIQKLTPLYVFIGIVAGFSFLIGFFLCMQVPAEDLSMIILFYAVISAIIGILFLQLEKLRKKSKS